MKKSLQSSVLLLMALMVPVTATAAYEQLADGVYQDGSTLYISSGVTSLGPLQVNPSAVYSFAATPPTCAANTFTGYGAILHMPAASYGAYFIASYWCNFLNMSNDAVEPTDVYISNSIIELIRGNSYNLNATVSPNNASIHSVTWSSTYPSVAIVNNGIVTALEAGECDIVAACLDKQAVCHVTVLDPFSITIDQTSIVIEQTQQVTLTATIIPESVGGQDVTWSTTNANVATVSNGVVTGIGVGECDIIASYFDKQAVCHVKVVEAIIHITLDKHEVKLKPNHSIIITPSTSPLETTLKVIVNNPEIAAARLANEVIQVVGLKEGVTMIVVGSTDGQAISDTCKVTVYTENGDVNCDGYVNISDVTTLIDFLLSDNPEGLSINNADTNRDGNVNISDVTMLIDYLLGGVDLNPPVDESFTVNGVTFKMVAVEGGTFMMGATAEQGSDAYDNERPAHQVTLSSFAIGETEVTQALWVAVMGSNPSRFTPAHGYEENLQRPVENVSWSACQTFITRLNQLTDRNFRLPTEAEWEFAARGGNKSQGYKYAGSNVIDDVAWYWDNSNSITHPVAMMTPNELGLYDMSGNVWEYCQDWIGNYSSVPQTNPTGPESGTDRVRRSGGWGGNAGSCRVSARTMPGISYYQGLRLAL